MNATTHMNEVRRGSAVYTPLVLAVYDHFVLGFSCTVLWRCPRRHLVALYRRNMGQRHLDVGVGTGRLIAEAAPPAGTTIVLADVNQASLAKATATLRRYTTRTVVANALEPLPFEPSSFDSASANFLLHCLPGSIAEKSTVLRHMAASIRPGGRLFGSTILAKGVPVNHAAQRLMDYYHRKGIFHNSDDSLDDLRTALAAISSDYKLVIQGCVAIFECTVGPR